MNKPTSPLKRLRVAIFGEDPNTILVNEWVDLPHSPDDEASRKKVSDLWSRAVLSASHTECQSCKRRGGLLVFLRYDEKWVHLFACEAYGLSENDGFNQKQIDCHIQDGFIIRIEKTGHEKLDQAIALLKGG